MYSHSNVYVRTYVRSLILRSNKLERPTEASYVRKKTHALAKMSERAFVKRKNLKCSIAQALQNLANVGDCAWTDRLDGEEDRINVLKKTYTPSSRLAGKRTLTALVYIVVVVVRARGQAKQATFSTQSRVKRIHRSTSLIRLCTYYVRTTTITTVLFSQLTATTVGP